MNTPKALATQMVLNNIKQMIESGEYEMPAQLQNFKPSAVRQKLAALHNELAHSNKLKDRIAEV